MPTPAQMADALRAAGWKRCALCAESGLTRWLKSTAYRCAKTDTAYRHLQAEQERDRDGN